MVVSQRIRRQDLRRRGCAVLMQAVFLLSLVGGSGLMPAADAAPGTGAVPAGGVPLQAAGETNRLYGVQPGTASTLPASTDYVATTVLVDEPAAAATATAAQLVTTVRTGIVCPLLEASGLEAKVDGVSLALIDCRDEGTGTPSQKVLTFAVPVGTVADASASVELSVPSGDSTVFQQGSGGRPVSVLQVQGPKPGAPPVPTITAQSGTDARTIRVTFSDPGPATTQVVLRAATDKAGVAMAPPVATFSRGDPEFAAREFIHKDLLPKLYHYQATFVQDAQAGKPSEVKSATPKAGAFAAHATRGADWIEVTWEPMARAQFYDILVNNTGNPDAFHYIAEIPATAPRVFRHEGLPGDAQRTYLVRAIVGGVDAGEAKVTSSTFRRASPPQSFTAAYVPDLATPPPHEPAPYDVRLAWTAPSFTDSLPITSYTVQRASSPAGPWTTALTTNADGAFTVTVPASDVYYYRVFANTAALSPGQSSNIAAADTRQSNFYTPAPTVQFNLPATCATRGGNAVVTVSPAPSLVGRKVYWDAATTGSGTEILAVDLPDDDFAAEPWLGQQRYYRQEAVHQGVTVSSTWAGATIPALSPVASLWGYATSTGGIQLVWKPGLTAAQTGVVNHHLWLLPEAPEPGATYPDSGPTVGESFGDTDSSAPSHTTSTLAPDTDYHLLVAPETCLDKEGKTHWSLASYVHVRTASKPAAIENVMITPGPAPAALRVGWSKPYDGGSPIVGYRIERGFTEDGPFETIGRTQELGTSDVGLDPYSSYCYRVRAYNDIGTGEPGPATCGEPAPFPPTEPIVTARTGSLPGSIVVEWGGAGTGGGTIAGYDVFIADRAAGPYVRILAGTTATNLTDIGLDDGVTRHYYAIAYNEMGAGPKSTIASATTIGYPTVPLDLKATGGDERIDVTWSGPASDGRAPILHYTLQLERLDGTGQATYTVAGTSFALVGLAWDETWRFRVSAANILGDGPASATQATTFGLPDAPAPVLGGTSRMRGATALAWSLPDDGGYPILHYSVYEHTPSGDTHLVDVTPMAFIEAGLPDGVTKHYRVSAWNKAGESPLSAVASASTPRPPSAPLGPAVDAAGTLQWLEPHSDGGMPILQYDLYETDDPAGTWSHLATAPSSARSAPVPACTSGPCHYRVTATNLIGEGPPSDDVTQLDDEPFPPESIRGTTPGTGGTLQGPHECGGHTGGSINTVTGQFVQSLCLLPGSDVYPTLSMPVLVTHRSHAETTTSAGRNWFLSVERSIRMDAAGDAIVADGTGRMDRFPLVAGIYQSPPGFYELLEATPDGHRILHPGGLEETFDAQGRRVRVEDPYGNNVTFAYDGAGLVQAMTDAHGRVVEFEHEGGLLKVVRDWLGRNVTLTHNVEELERIQFPRGAPASTPPTYVFSYVGGSLSNATNARGDVHLENFYDEAWRVIDQIHGDGIWSLIYDPERRRTAILDPNLNIVEWTFHPSQPTPVLKVASVGRVPETGDGPAGPLSPVGSVLEAAIEATARLPYLGNETTRYETNDQLEIIRTVLPSGITYSTTFDHAAPDPRARGNVLEMATVTDEDPVPVRESFTYEPTFQGRKTATGAAGNAPGYVPDNGGAAAGRSTTTYYYGHEETPANDLNDDGLVGPPGRIVRIEYPTIHAMGPPHPELPGNQERVATFTYNARGQLVRETAPDGAVTEHHYHEPGDESVSLGNPAGTVRFIDRIPASADAAAASFSALDVEEDRVRIAFEHDLDGNLVLRTDPLGRETRYAYDGLGRLVEVQSAIEGHTRSFAYDLDGNIIGLSEAQATYDLDGSFTAGTPIVHQFEYDALGQKTDDWIDSRRPGTTPAGDPDLVHTQYRYDAKGNLVAIVHHAAGNGIRPADVETFVHDGRDRVVSHTVGGQPDAYVRLNGALPGAPIIDTLYLRARTPAGTDAPLPSPASRPAASVDIRLGPTVDVSCSADPRLAPGSPVQPPLPPQPCPVETNPLPGVPTPLDAGLGASPAGVEVTGTPEPGAVHYATAVREYFLAGEPGDDAEPKATAPGSGLAVAAVAGSTTWTWNSTTYSFPANRIQVVFWAAGASGDPVVNNTWRAVLRDGSREVANTTLAFPPIPAGERAEQRATLAFDTLGGGALSLTLQPLDPGDRMVLFDSPETPSRLEITQATTATTLLDEDGRVVRTIDPEGRTTSYEHDSHGRLTATVDHHGNRQQTTYDAVGRVKTRESHGSLGPSAGYSNDTVLLARQVAFYDEDGRLYRLDTARFDPRTQLPLPDSDLIPGDGYATTFYGYDHAGRLDRVVEANGNVHAAEHDALGRVVSRTDGTELGFSFTWNDAGDLVEVLPQRVVGDVASATGEAYLFSYDELGRRVRAVDPLGNTRHYGYDAQGRLAWETDAKGPAMPDVEGRFEGNLNGAGNLVEYQYDTEGRLVKTTRHVTDTGEGDGARIDAIETTNTWDGDGRLVAQTDDAGHTTRYEYDPQGRLVQETTPAGKVRRVTYDAAGNAIRIDLPDGTAVRQTFDGRNLLVRRDISGPSSLSTVQTFEHDGLGRLLRATDNNGPGAADDSVVTFAYDSTGQVLEETQDGLKVTKAYDEVGNPVQLALPSGFTTTRGYDGAGRLASIATPAGPAATFAYDRGRLATMATANGVTTSYGLDEAWRTSSIEASSAHFSMAYNYTYDRNGQRVATAVRHAPETGFLAAYDSLGRLTQYTRGNVESRILPALPAATPAGADAWSWTLDGRGNWLSTEQETGATATTTARTFDADNRLVPAPNAYDANGNQVQDSTGRGHTYDGLGRLRTTQTAQGVTTRIAYDALDRRVTRTSEGYVQGIWVSDSTRYIHDGMDLVEERRQDGTIHRFVHGAQIDSHILVNVRAPGGAESTFYYVQDILGSVTALTDIAGTVVEAYLYQPYGEPTVVRPGLNGVLDWGGDDQVVEWADTWRWFPDSRASAYGNPFLFTGQVYDAPTGLYQYRARFYNPAEGRFLSMDPIGAWGDMAALGNPYAYVGGRPMDMRDPYGLCGWSPWEWGSCVDDAVDAVVDTAKSVVDWVGDQCFSSVEAGIRCALVSGAVVATVLTGGAAAIVGSGILMTSIQDMLDGSLDSSLLEYGLSVMPFGKIGGGLLKMMGPAGKKVLAMFQQGTAKLQKLADDPFAAMQDASKHVAKATGVMKGSAKKHAKLLDDGLGGGDDLGVVYKRVDLNGGKPYVGQAKNFDRYVARQLEHRRAYPDGDFQFFELGRAPAGRPLNVLEEDWIRQLGGPTNKGNPLGGLANQRHQMSPWRYAEAGGQY